MRLYIFNAVDIHTKFEFALGKFSMYLKKENIQHKYIYPRCPRTNGCVERANRTLQEDFVYSNEEILCMGIEEFNKKLMDYLVWFNTKRPHQSLGNIYPINYVLKFNPECHMYASLT